MKITEKRRVTTSIIIIIIIGLIMFIGKAVYAGTTYDLSTTSIDTIKSNGKIGDIVKFNNGDLRRIKNIYCLEHRGDFITGEYKIYDIIDFDGKTITSEYKAIAPNTNTCNENATMAYLLSQGDEKTYKKGMYLDDTSVMMSARNIAIWTYQYRWFSTFPNGYLQKDWQFDEDKYNLNNWFLSQDGTGQRELAEALRTEAETYGNGDVPNGGESIAITGKTTVVELTNIPNVFGPFKVKFSGNNPTITAKDVFNNTIPSTDLEFYTNNECTSDSKKKGLKEIGSDKDFYIKVTGDKRLKTVTCSISGEKIQGKAFLLAKSDFWNSGGQSLILSDLEEKTITNSVTYTVTGALNIYKRDYNNKTKDLTGARFKIYNVGKRKWLYGGRSNSYTFVTYMSEASEYRMYKDAYKSTDLVYYDDENKVLRIRGLPAGTYNIFEVKGPDSDSEGDYELVAQTGYEVVGGVGRVDVFKDKANRNIKIPDDNNSWSASRTVYNKKSNGRFTLSKKDTDANTLLDGAEFAIKEANGGWLSSNTAPYTYSADYSNAVKFKLNDSNNSNSVTYDSDKRELTIKGLKAGTYHIYETKAPEGYKIEKQVGYDETNKYVDTGINVAMPDSEGSWSQYISIPNTQLISFKGKVWKEKYPIKGSERDYDSLYKEIDENIAGVKVYLKNKETKEPIKVNGKDYVETNTNGEYEFIEVVPKAKVEDYYLEFDYSSINQGSTKYIPVAFKAGVDNGSKALTNELPYIDAEITGIATTYKEANSDSNAQNIAEYGLVASGKWDENDPLILKNINLGLKPVKDPDHKVDETLASTRIKVKDYEYNYIFEGDDEELRLSKILDSAEVSNEGTQNGPTTNTQADISSYSNDIYPSEIGYLKENNEHKDDIEVFVKYRIDVKNTMTKDIAELYQQTDELTLTTLIDEFDNNRYELHDSNWELVAGSTNKAKIKNMQLINSSKGNLSSGEKQYVFIEFKVKNSAIIDILNHPNGIIEEYPTNAVTNGYHEYYRDDYTWKNLENENQLIVTAKHKTKDIEKDDKAPYLIFKLGPERTVSGTVFEDGTVEARVSKGEKVGDGIYNDGTTDGESKEKGVEGVKVELLEVTGDVSKLYQRKDIGDPNINIKSAIVTTSSEDNHKGEFSLTGVLPGRYFLRFTYGNGEYTITDLNGNTISTFETKINGKKISANDYKSTIVQEYIQNAFNINEEGKTDKELLEKTYAWYKDADKNYSIALDDLNQRAAINQDNNNSIQSMSAKSPKISITIENTTDNSIYKKANTQASEKVVAKGSESVTINKIINGDDYNNTFGGFYFGMIEQPKQKVDIEKVITNIKLQTAQGPVIFNGNPEDAKTHGGTAAVSDLDFKANGGSTYSKAEIPEDDIYGSNLEMTYEIRITNMSDVNYYDEDYYYYGEIVNPEHEVTLTPTTVVDCLDELLDYDEETTRKLNDQNRLNDGTERSITSTANNKTTVKIDDEDIKVNSYQLKNWKNLYTSKKPSRRENELTTDKFILFAKREGIATLNENSKDDEEDLLIANYVEVTEAENAPGADDPGGLIKIIKKPSLEEAHAHAILTIYPLTGKDKISGTVYAIAGIIALVILATGIVIIKKKIA